MTSKNCKHYRAQQSNMKYKVQRESGTVAFSLWFKSSIHSITCSDWSVRTVSINSWLDNQRHLFMPDVIDKWTPQRLYIDVNIGGNTFQVMNVKAKLFQRVWRFMLMLIDCFVFLFIRHCTKLKPPCAFPNQVHFEYQNPNFTAWAFCFSVLIEIRGPWEFSILTPYQGGQYEQGSVVLMRNQRWVGVCDIFYSAQA